MAVAVGAEAANKVVEKVAVPGGKVVNKDGRRPATPGMVGNTSKPSVKKITPRAASPDSAEPAKKSESSKPKLTSEEIEVAKAEAKKRAVKEQLDRNARRIERARIANSKSGVEEQTRPPPSTDEKKGSSKPKLTSDELVIAEMEAKKRQLKEMLDRNACRVEKNRAAKSKTGVEEQTRATSPTPAPFSRQASPRPRSCPPQEKLQPLTRPASPGRQAVKTQAKPALTRPASASRLRPASPQVHGVRKMLTSTAQKKTQTPSASNTCNENTINSAGSESHVEKAAQGVASASHDAPSNVSEHSGVCAAAAQAEAASATTEEEKDASDDLPLPADAKLTPRRETPVIEHKRKALAGA